MPSSSSLSQERPSPLSKPARTTFTTIEAQPDEPKQPAALRIRRSALVVRQTAAGSRTLAADALSDEGLRAGGRASGGNGCMGSAVDCQRRVLDAQPRNVTAIEWYDGEIVPLAGVVVGPHHRTHTEAYSITEEATAASPNWGLGADGCSSVCDLDSKSCQSLQLSPPQPFPALTETWVDLSCRKQSLADMPSELELACPDADSANIHLISMPLSSGVSVDQTQFSSISFTPTSSPASLCDKTGHWQAASPPSPPFPPPQPIPPPGTDTGITGDELKQQYWQLKYASRDAHDLRYETTVTLLSL